MTGAAGIATVLAVHRSRRHDFSKFSQATVKLVAEWGVEGDAHAGLTVQHRSRVARDPSQPNLRQVHLLHAELFEQLMTRGFSVHPGDLGENITTRGVDLLALPAGTLLHLGREAVVEVTGLRNPCSQIDRFQQGLMVAVLDRDSSGQLVRKAGVMGVVLTGGEVSAGDVIRIVLPPPPHGPLVPV
ncbi:MOSC domain-containing protein [Polaromonas eurypsychrophila]|uniref:MOSC domain-containing protein n=1 Tax=Polaromonas eurypsychrophila TaxID=1614635 RepID=A0A916WLS2_9BURK|nr:MOSC domain-containing protein [Polaromonas eurypsychrophila]GGB14018.1 MOSC domain-containing protein [Polaromonas eurypsychrophila]